MHTTSWNDSHRLFSSIVETWRKSYFGNVEPLTKWGVASSFLLEYAAKLCKIELEVETHEDDFSDLRKCVNARCVTSLDVHAGTLSSLLEACASTLEELIFSINPAGDAVEVMVAVRNNCKQLRVFNIRNLGDVIDIVGQESYSSLICSYGSHLKSANIDRLDREHLVEVANTCVNLEVSVYWTDDPSVDCQFVCDVGPRVAKLLLDPKYLCDKDCPRAFERCSNLRRLDMSPQVDAGIRRVTDEVIANVFAPSRFRNPST